MVSCKHYEVKPVLERTFQLMLAAFAAAVAGKAIQPSEYKVEVKHDRSPVKRHGDFHQHHHAPIAPILEHHGEEESQHDDYYAYPKYKFEYGVKDPHTGDHKSHWEIRDGDKVHGEYSLDEADGTTRVVSYTSDNLNGFRAVVKKIGKAQHPKSEQDFQQPFY